jgi:hypothetical protein
MALVTLRALDGADRGHVFENVATPVTIGREEGNSVQLSDERISRFHLKIQEGDEKLVLTDLDSTNGTQVNGESVRVWVLRPGDVISLGRTVLLFGSPAEIATRLAELRGADLSAGVVPDEEEIAQASPRFTLESEFHHGDQPEDWSTLHTLLPPELPNALEPCQAAQLAELLLYFHLRIRGLLQSVSVEPRSETVTLQQRQWQNLLDLQGRIAGYLRAIGEPEGGEG